MPTSDKHQTTAGTATGVAAESPHGSINGTAAGTAAGTAVGVAEGPLVLLDVLRLHCARNLIPLKNPYVEKGAGRICHLQSYHDI